MQANLQRKEAQRPKDAYYYDLNASAVYRPLYGWDLEFDSHYRAVKDITEVSIERLWTIYLMARQSVNVEGCFMECGVFRGGTAALIAKVADGRKPLHLFDTFTGMPECDSVKDDHTKGDFSEVSIDAVRKVVGNAEFHQGWIPETFSGLDGMKIAFAHLDVDIYRSMKDCLEFVYPRMTVGGVMVLDDYGQFTCRGARDAIDEYFADKRSVPLSLMSKQAVVFKI